MYVLPIETLYFLPHFPMAEVHHIHHDVAEDAGISSAMLAVLLIALVALAVFVFFALSGLSQFAPAAENDTRRSVNVQGDLIVPVTPGGANSSY